MSWAKVLVVATVVGLAAGHVRAEDPRDTEIRTLQAENKVLRATIHRLSQENDDLKETVNRLNARLEALQAKEKTTAPAPQGKQEPPAPSGHVKKDEKATDPKYEFTPLPSFKISPRFDLGADLTMGNWSYRGLIIRNKDTGKTELAVELTVEVQAEGISLPPLILNAEAKGGENNIVGTGMLMIMHIGVMEKSSYRGLILLESPKVEVISLRKDM